MTQEHDVLKFRCGGPVLADSDAPVFNDLASTRSQPLHERVGLLRAVELIRAIGGSKGCMSVPHLVIDDPADLAGGRDRWIIALLVKQAGSELIVSGQPATIDVLDRNEDLAYVLRLFAEVGNPARLKRRRKSDNWKQSAAGYLCSDLGLTGKHAAWALNLVTAPGTFNEKSVRYYATKSDKLEDFIEIVSNMPEFNPFDVSSIDGLVFQSFLGSSITLRLPEELADVNRDLFHYAALAYNEIQPKSMLIPDAWPNPSLRPSWEDDIDAAMRVIVPVRRRAYATQPWPPADTEKARTFATKLAQQGCSMRDIAAALDEEGYRVSRQGGWHYRSVTKLLQQPQPDNRQGGAR
jgi:hypothetical protein